MEEINKKPTGYNKVKVGEVEVESETETLTECLNATMWLLSQEPVKTKVIDDITRKRTYIG